MTRIFRPTIQNVYVWKNKALINTVGFSCYLFSYMTSEALLLIIFLSNKIRFCCSMGHVLDIVYVGTRYITYLRSFLHSFIMVRNNINIKKKDRKRENKNPICLKNVIRIQFLRVCKDRGYDYHLS